jgi:hypothetical protein
MVYNINWSKEGAVSEWNEGNWKSLRLHEAQNLMNNSYMDLLKYNPFTKSYGYENWISATIILFKEGQSKYSDEEFSQVYGLKEEILKIMNENPPFLRINEDTLNGIRQRDVFNYYNWEKIRLKAEEFETLVKKYNDKHGLSTRNIDKAKGMF